ncbi:MAG TPA: nucleotidyltransferase domain-containing protein [Kofleriaceae bacterium]|nr:nucleotidyltransferase domain-containing protein [Kofleriaceae bacterium]
MATDLRLRGLRDIAETVPLPHGTEVITRVDRVLGDRRIPRGAMGRVVRIVGDEVTVQVIGAGAAAYARSELTPRKAGQLRFARRREVAWQSLRPCLVLEAVVGSRAWGLAGDDSDTDRRGLFALPFPWTAGLAPVPDDLVSADGSSTYWEVGKAIRQALRADPNTLEVLFASEVDIRDPIGAWLRDARELFVSAEIYASFGRYALSQAKKLRQSLRLAEHRDLLLEWLRASPAPSLDQAATRLADATGLQAPSEADRLLRAKEYIKQLYYSLHDRGLVPAANFESFVEFARGAAGGFDLPRELRPKNAYNLVRLIATAITWLRTGAADFRVAEPLRSRLLAIKRGEVSLADVLDQAEHMAAELEAARRETRLPVRGDVTLADALLHRVREELARRWVQREPGPFGLDAPASPEAQWED